MKIIDYSKEDKVGEGTLDVIAKADNFNRWMFNTILPHCKGHILEIGSGIGNISKYFFKQNFSLFLTDISPHYCNRLRNTFGNQKELLGVRTIDLIDPEFDSKHKDLFNTFDTLFALNVIEHIGNHGLAIKNCRKLLKNEGNLIILVPSYKFLYNGFDENLGHYRRYNRKSLRRLMQNMDVEILHEQYFNFVGIFGWYVSGNLLKRKAIPSGQMSLYNALVPIIKLLDKIIFNVMGLSTIIVVKCK